MTDKPRNIDCDQAVKMLLQYLDNDLGTANHVAMEHHLHSCRSCFSHMEFEKRLKDMVRDSNGNTGNTASEDLRARIKNLTDHYLFKEK